MKCIIGRKIKNPHNNLFNRNLIKLSSRNIRSLRGINDDVNDKMIELVK